MEEEGINGNRMRTATVMSQTGWPTSLSSKGTLTLSVASAGDLCLDIRLPSLLSYGGESERKGGPFPMAAGREGMLWAAPSSSPGYSPSPFPSPFSRWDRGYSVLRWPQQHSVLHSCLCKVLPDDTKSSVLSGEPTLRLLCVLMTQGSVYRDLSPATHGTKSGLHEGSVQCGK